jgi:ubiquinone/menaquinone biosynthesis C-methylase UbiE
MRISFCLIVTLLPPKFRARQASRCKIDAMLDAAQQASRDQFEKQSDRYGKSHILVDTSDVAAGLEGLIFSQDATALDVATGGGHTAIYLAGLGLKVMAADISPAMLANAKKLAEERGFTIETCLHEAEKFPYADASFDLVTCRVAAHHFSDREAFLRETLRVLKPGGHFLLIDGSVPDGEPEAEEWIHQVEKFRDPSHGRFLSPSSWSALCAAAGLNVLRSETHPLKQPDLEWYFRTAATSPENREKVRSLVADAPNSARRVFSIGEEDGRVVWWWPRLSLLAKK